MKTQTYKTIFKIAFVLCALVFTSCAENKKEEVAPVVEQEIPMLEIASEEYVEVVQDILNQMGDFNHEAYGAYLADNINWYWPDGSSETRHTMRGKDSIMAFWKNWEETIGGEMSFTNSTFLPIKLNKPSNHYKFVGSGVLTYTDLTISVQDKTASVRQHIVFMFNDDKKVSEILLYYDRSGIMEMTKIAIGDMRK